MRTLYLMCVCCFLLLTDVSAQGYYSATDTGNIDQTQNNSVTILPLNKPAIKQWYDVGPYWIGNNNHASGYKFLFLKPVTAIKAYISALDSGEIIKFHINDLPYTITSNEVSMYKGTASDALIPVIKNGSLTSINKKGWAATQIDIAPGYPIKSVEIEQINGVNNGSVFNLLYLGSTNPSNNNPTESNITNIGYLFSIYPNPNNGVFTLECSKIEGPYLTVDILNMSGQSVFKSEIAPTNHFVKKQIALENNISPGMYMIRLHGDNYNTTRFFTLTK